MSFDYLVVGGGAAGAVIAARLSEKPENRVALIEAGSDTPPNAVPDDISDTFPVSYSNPAYFWPELMAGGRVGTSPTAFHQARIMGGGSSVMGMWALRGLPGDYDGWRERGAVGWGWGDVLPSFLKLERDLDCTGHVHGKDGPIPIRRHKFECWPTFTKSLAVAAAGMGLQLKEDINGEFDDGVFPVPVTNDHGGRVSSARGYLTCMVRQRPNLHIYCDCFVKRIVFDGRRAVGAEVDRDGSVSVILAHEIIVSAGAIGSPAILLRSGLGPGAELSRLGIACIADMPGVGQQLQNHCIINLSTRIKPAARQSSYLRSYGVACARMSSMHRKGKRGDLHFQFITKTSLNPHGDKLAVVGVALFAPLSRGSVSLASGNLYDPPKVDFRLLDHSADRERLVMGVNIAKALLTNETVARLRDEVFLVLPSSMVRRLNRPGFANRALSCMLSLALDMPHPIRRFVASRAGLVLDAIEQPGELDDSVLNYTIPIFHPSGTCAIGRDGDVMAVLDHRCRVRAVERLRVADASIMPDIPVANTCLPAMMIGEHLSSMMLRGL